MQRERRKPRGESGRRSGERREATREGAPRGRSARNDREVGGRRRTLREGGPSRAGAGGSRASGLRTAASSRPAPPLRPPRSDERLIIGRNPIAEALAVGRRLKRLYVAGDEGREAFANLIEAARSGGAIVDMVTREQLDVLVGPTGHQGVVAVADEFRYVDVDAILERAEQAGEAPFLLLLDHLEDPQNFGSLVRTAEAAGAHGVVIPERRAVGVTPAVSKASAGAVEHLPIARVKNMVHAMERLKRAGVWIVGADLEGETSLHSIDMGGPVAIVIGAEGRGLSRLVSERCDHRVRIPMRGRIQSLNASVAGALLMFEVVRRRGGGSE